MSNEKDFDSLENDFEKLESKYNKNKLNISFNRAAFIFFTFILVLLIFSLKAFYLSGKKLSKNKTINTNKEIRSNILDRNNVLLAKTIITRNIGINPNLVIDKKKLILNLKILFPNKNYKMIQDKLNGNKFFYFAEELNPENYEKLMMLGDKSLIPENRITRIYPQKNLFSHIIGQIDNENNGVSGLEKSYDKKLKLSNQDLKLTIDINLQYLIREELIKFQNIFSSIGSAVILMNVNNGEILSLLSLPDYDLNQRQLLDDKEVVDVPDRPEEFNTWSRFVIQVDRRDELKKYLRSKGIVTGIHYPTPLHLQPAASQLGYKSGDLPVTEYQATRILSLPVHQYLDEEKIRYVADSINDFYSKISLPNA